MHSQRFKCTPFDGFIRFSLNPPLAKHADSGNSWRVWGEGFAGRSCNEGSPGAMECDSRVEGEAGSVDGRIYTAILSGGAAAPPRGDLPVGYTIACLADNPVADPGLYAYRWYRGTVDGLLVLEPTLQGCRDMYGRLLAGERGRLSERDSMVLLRDGKVVGACYVTRSGRHFHIADLSLASDVRGQGLGRKLLETVLLGISRRKCKTLELEVTGENKRALSLYSSLGFEIRGVSHLYVRRKWKGDPVFPPPVRRRICRIQGWMGSGMRSVNDTVNGETV